MQGCSQAVLGPRALLMGHRGAVMGVEEGHAHSTRTARFCKVRGRRLKGGTLPARQARLPGKIRVIVGILRIRLSFLQALPSRRTMDTMVAGHNKGSESPSGMSQTVADHGGWGGGQQQGLTAPPPKSSKGHGRKQR